MAMKAHLEPVLEAATHRVEGRRQSRRALRLETSGRLPAGIEANVTIHNLSAAGLLLETDLPLALGEALSVDLPEAGPVGVEIVWASGNLFGCAFDQALGEAALAAAQLRGAAGAAEQARKREQPVAFGQNAVDPLGVRLNRLRRERGLTLAQVASALDVSKPTVWAWEKGKARPIPERLGPIADVLGVSEADLLDAGSGNEGSALVEECRQRIAAAYSTPARNVRIMIEV